VRRVRDFVIYILIGLAIAAGAFWSTNYNISEESFHKWGGYRRDILVVDPAISAALAQASVLVDDIRAAGRTPCGLLGDFKYTSNTGGWHGSS
jgi:hypothetical protein